MGQALIGIEEFDEEWKVVVGGFSSDFDIYAAFVNKTDVCIIEFDEKKEQYIISHRDETWSKQVAFEKMQTVAKVIFGFIAPEAPCSMRLNIDVQ